MDSDKIPITLLLTGPEVELLDRAVSNFVTPVPEARPEFTLYCLRYGLLSLAESGWLELEVRGETPEFVRSYREMVAGKGGPDADTGSEWVTGPVAVELAEKSQK